MAFRKLIDKKGLSQKLEDNVVISEKICLFMSTMLEAKKLKFL